MGVIEADFDRHLIKPVASEELQHHRVAYIRSRP